MASPVRLDMFPGESKTLAITLSRAPTSDVSITPTPVGLGFTSSIMPTTLAFTPSDHDEAQTITVVTKTGSVGVGSGTLTLVATRGTEEIHRIDVEIASTARPVIPALRPIGDIEITQKDMETVTVSLSGAPAGDVSATVSSSSGSPFSLSPSSSIAFTPAVFSVDLTVTSDEDAGNGTVTITPGTGISGTAVTFNVTVTSPTLDIDEDSCGSPIGVNGVCFFDVELTDAPYGNVTVALSPGATTERSTETGISIEDDADLTFTVSDYAIPKTVRVDAWPSTVPGDYTVTLTATGGGVNDSEDVTITVEDEEPATVTINDASADEGDALTFTVSLDNAVSGGFTVTPNYTDGTATKGTDYAENTPAIRFTGDANETKTFTVSTTEDAVVEPDETFTVGLTISGTSVTITASDTGTGTIVNDDVAPDVVVTIPGAPTSLSATARGQTAIDLDWTAPANTGGAAISEYQIEFSIDGGGSFSDLVANTGNTNTSYSHTGLTANTERCYRVSAINSAGTGSPSNVACATTAEQVNLRTIRSFSLPTTSSRDVTVSLTGTPTGTVTVTQAWSSGSPDGLGSAPDTDLILNSGNSYSRTLTVQSGASTGQGTLTLTATGGGVNDSESFTVTVEPRPELIVTPPSLDLFTEEAKDFTVRLNRQPPSTSTIAVSQPSGLTVSSGSLTFTRSNWNVSQPVTVTAGSTDAGSPFTITVRGNGSGSVTDRKDVKVTVNARPQLRASTTALTINQGASTDITLSLSLAPSVGVSVRAITPTLSRGAMTVSPTTQAFTQTVFDGKATIRASDHATPGTHTVTFRPNGNAGVVNDVVVAVTVNKVPPVLQFEGGGDRFTATWQAGTAVRTLSITTNKTPDDDVTVDVEQTPPDTFNEDTQGSPFDWVGVTGTPTILASTGDGTPTVLKGNFNPYLELPVGEYTITFTPSGGDVTNVVEAVVTVTAAAARTEVCIDGDCKSAPHRLVMAPSTSVSLGIALSRAPTGDLPVSLTSASGASTDITLSTQTFTFTPQNWNVEQSLTVMAADMSAGESHNAQFSLMEDGVPSTFRRQLVIEVEAPSASAKIFVSNDPLDPLGPSETHTITVKTSEITGNRSRVTVSAEIVTPVSYLSVTPEQLRFCPFKNGCDGGTYGYYDSPQGITITTTDQTENTTHTLRLTARGDGFPGITEIVTIETVAPCTAIASALQTSRTSLHFGEWIRPATGTGMVGIDPMTVQVTPTNIVAQSGGATPSVGAFTVNATDCKQCTVTITRPSTLTNTASPPNTLSFASAWAKQERGAGAFSSVPANSSTVTALPSEFRVGGTISGISITTPPDSYENTISVNQSCE